ncbi:MAG: hypothetical protein GY720_04995 [bacterium]|nr:hypothetical protein [bacterium]
MKQKLSAGVVLLAMVAAACGGTSPSDSSVDPATSVTVQPISVGEPTSPLGDGSTITQDDSGQMFFTTAASRLQLQLSNDWLWSEPTINRPHQLIAINFVTDPGYSAWDILINEPGDVVVEASGMQVCDDCESLEFSVVITAQDE